MIAAGDDYADRNRAQIKKEPEIIEIPVKKRILVVPFDLKRDPILITINLMSR